MNALKNTLALTSLDKNEDSQVNITLNKDGTMGITIIHGLRTEDEHVTTSITIPLTYDILMQLRNVTRIANDNLLCLIDIKD